MKKVNFDSYLLSGIMFHYFHDENNFLKSQGSISAKELEIILKKIRNKVQILSPTDFRDNLLSPKPEKATCITFDDGLLSQYKVAEPVLNSYGIKAFFFVYSNIWDERFETPCLEFFRDFRNSYKGGIKKYYDDFFIQAKKCLGCFNKEIKIPVDYLSDCPFYSYEDKLYRFYRDILLSPDQYREILMLMLKSNEYNFEKNKNQLFMNLNQLLELISNGHEIGLHSSSHPTDMNRLDEELINAEYSNNYSFLEKRLKIKPFSASYPCGVFNYQTEKIMRNLNIQLAFASSLSQYDFSEINALLLPREDHANLL